MTEDYSCAVDFRVSIPCELLYRFHVARLRVYNAFGGFRQQKVVEGWPTIQELATLVYPAPLHAI